MFRITPVYGSRWSPSGAAEEPSCTLVEYAGCRVLFNVGWWAENTAALAEGGSDSFPNLPEHDCLILSDSTLQSCGGLPLYYQQMKRKQAVAAAASDDSYAPPPIYATFPTVKMGQMCLYDSHAAVSLDGGRPAYSLEDVDSVFSSIRSIKYSQAVTISPKEMDKPSLSITAHRAGHVVGGAFFVLQRLQDETVAVLTAHYHIARELHLDSCTLLKYGSTPDVLVTRPGGAAFCKLRALSHGKPKKHPALPPQLVTQAERNLTEAVMAVLRREGNVLLPADPSGRVLELILLLNQHWHKERLAGAYNLVWLGPMVTNTIEFARSQMEWMSLSVGRAFDSQAGHPFSLKNVQFCSSMADLETVMEENQNPVCVVATGLSLDAGPARDVLLKWADNPDNAIILTDSSQCYLRKQQRREGTTPSMAAAVQGAPLDATMPAATSAATGTTPAAEDQDETEEGGMMVGSATDVVSEWTAVGQLLSAWAEAKASGQEMDDVVAIDVNVPVRAPLAGLELKAFLADEEAARQRLAEEKEKRAMLREVELAKGRLRLGEEDTTAAASTATETKATAAVSSAAGTARPRKKSRFDSTLFLKFSKPLHLTFEVREEAVGVGQSDSTAKYGIGESVGRSGEVLEDDYGIAVQPERFTDIVSGVDPSKFAGGSGRIGEEVLRRGFGYGVDAGRSSSAKKKPSTIAARVSEDEDQDDSDEMDEQALEAVDLSEGNGIVRGRNGRPPTKVTTVPRRLEVLAEVSFVPLEGRVDARAARQSVRALQPREVIVMGGPAGSNETEPLVDEVSLLAEAAESFATGSEFVYTPSDSETVELNIGHAAFAVRIIDTPYQTREDTPYQTREEKESGAEAVCPFAVRMIDTPYQAREERESGVEALELVEPFEAKVGDCSVSLLDCIATGQRVALDGSIVLAPRPVSSGNMPSVYLSGGEVLLTDLRAELIAQGMKAEYSAHSGYSQLVVNGKIVVKKDQMTGRMHVEGPLCEDFYTVRSVVCSQYVTL